MRSHDDVPLQTMAGNIQFPVEVHKFCELGFPWRSGSNPARHMYLTIEPSA